MEKHAQEADIGAMHAYSIDNARAEKISEAFKKNKAPCHMSGRGVLFLTEKCNLNCLYCKTKHIKKADFTVEDALDKVKQWAQAGCKYLHLTGGEATIHKGLVDIVKCAKVHSMISSISTNGTAAATLYDMLVNSGAKFFYISLDSDNEADFDSSVRMTGAFDRVVTSIQYLANLRDKQKKDVYITVNCMIYQENFHKILDLTHFVQKLRPDDFKLIPTTKFMSSITPEQEQKVKELLDSEEVNKDKFSFFHYRLKHFSTMRGLKDKKYQGLRCYICSDERSIGPEGYYPCNIYFRENGKPIGYHKEDDFETQSQKLFEFAKNHDITRDPICREFCCDITRDFNLAVREMLRKS